MLQVVIIPASFPANPPPQLGVGTGGAGQDVQSHGYYLEIKSAVVALGHSGEHDSRLF